MIPLKVDMVLSKRKLQRHEAAANVEVAKSAMPPNADSKISVAPTDLKETLEILRFFINHYGVNY